MKISEKKIRSALYSLGRGPDQIAKSLRNRRIKGTPYDELNCPITEFLRRKFKGFSFLMGAGLEYCDAEYKTVGEISPNRQILRFVTNFDNGKYTTLIAD